MPFYKTTHNLFPKFFRNLQPATCLNLLSTGYAIKVFGMVVEYRVCYKTPSCHPARGGQAATYIIYLKYFQSFVYFFLLNLNQNQKKEYSLNWNFFLLLALILFLIVLKNLKQIRLRFPEK